MYGTYNWNTLRNTNFSRWTSQLNNGSMHVPYARALNWDENSRYKYMSHRGEVSCSASVELRVQILWSRDVECTILFSMSLQTTLPIPRIIRPSQLDFSMVLIPQGVWYFRVSDMWSNPALTHRRWLRIRVCCFLGLIVGICVIEPWAFTHALFRLLYNL